MISENDLDAVAAVREQLQEEPAAFCLPLGELVLADHGRCLALAASLLLWVAQREGLTVEAAQRLVGQDYVFSAILRRAAELEEVQP